jgi:hypothetical protein
MEPRGDRLAGQKGRAPEALGHFVEPMACLGSDFPTDPDDIEREALSVRGVSDVWKVHPDVE